jgi:hypothetical protein
MRRVSGEAEWQFVSPLHTFEGTLHGLRLDGCPVNWRELRELFQREDDLIKHNPVSEDAAPHPFEGPCGTFF